ncbi:MAG: type II toxin-antitoxin system YafQ family toxin [Candidatus Aureabacteria bacterium]|nr:type II toxin-antitoxin system YafQ family toxin [Candidatus Auribacterota bacterium]
MLTPYYTAQFKKDIKRQQKRKKDLSKIQSLMNLLIDRKKLPSKYRDHKLTGDYKDFRDCHIEPDWLLIYKIEEKEIFFTRTGSHSDLFE